MKKNYRNLTKLLNNTKGYFKKSTKIADMEKLTPFVERVQTGKSTFGNHYMSRAESMAKGFKRKDWEQAREYFVKEIMGNKSGDVKLTQANINRLETKKERIEHEKVNKSYNEKADKNIKVFPFRLYDEKYWSIRNKLTKDEWEMLKTIRNTGVDFYGAYDIVWGMHIGDYKMLKTLEIGTETDKVIKKYIETNFAKEIKKEKEEQEKADKENNSSEGTLVKMRKGVRK